MIAKDSIPEQNIRRSFAVKAALFALRFYKAYLSILFAGACRFDPTCSRYAYEAIERFGLARGVWLGIKRLGCCHPFSPKFGYDPIPEKTLDAPSKLSGSCHAYWQAARKFRNSAANVDEVHS